VRVGTFAFVAADVARGGALDDRVADLPTATRRAWDEQTERSTWIDYAGPPRTVHRVSALDVLDGRGTAEDFRGKLVVIGVTAREHPDKHATPFNEDRVMPGAEVQAHAIATMYRDEPLRSTVPFVDVLAIVLVGFLPALAVLSGSRLLRAVAIAAVAIAFVVVAQLAFDGGRIVAIVPALAALLVATVGLATVPFARAVRRWNVARVSGEQHRLSSREI
jgi:CHASE2 domain-containing sensor protein